MTDDHQDAAAELLGRLQAGETLGSADMGAFLVSDATGFTARGLGLVWDTFAFDRVSAHLDADERHHQPFGIVHGGVWCAVVESLASIAGVLRVATTGKVVVGVNNTTDFLRAHRHGRVDAVATPIHVGRTQQLWQVVITRAEDGKAVARGQVRLHNVEPVQVGG